jgi:hypothetical protein
MVNTQATSEDEGTSFAPTILKPRQQTSRLTNPAQTGLPDGDRESDKEVAVSQGKQVVSNHDYGSPLDGLKTQVSHRQQAQPRGRSNQNAHIVSFHSTSRIGETILQQGDKN